MNNRACCKACEVISSTRKGTLTRLRVMGSTYDGGYHRTTSRISIPAPVVPKPVQGSGNGCLPGEGDTDLVHEVSGTLSKGDDSRMGGQDSCVPATITKGGTSHECVRGRAKRMPADACI